MPAEGSFHIAPPSGSYGGYSHVQPDQQLTDYNHIPSQHAHPAQMFVPSQAPHVPQPSIAPSPVSTQPPVRPFVPATPPTLGNVQNGPPSSLGSQLYPGASHYAYNSGPRGSASYALGAPHVGAVPGSQFPPSVVQASTPKSFIPVNSRGVIQRPGASPAQPSSPTQPMKVQPGAAVLAPSPTVLTADTSSVAAEMRPVITTLTRLYQETSEALGGTHANPSKKREIDDNSRKIGALFAKLNSGDISPNVASKLRQLCDALDAGNFANAMHIQVILTTSDWDECNLWLAALKRMIKTRQNARIN